MAVNVTVVPEQIVVLEAEIETAAVNIGLTVITKAFEVAGEPIRHGVALDVICTVTEAPFEIAVVVNVEVVCPATGFPFTNH